MNDLRCQLKSPCFSPILVDVSSSEHSGIVVTPTANDIETSLLQLLQEVTSSFLFLNYCFFFFFPICLALLDSSAPIHFQSLLFDVKCFFLRVCSSYCVLNLTRVVALGAHVSERHNFARRVSFVSSNECFQPAHFSLLSSFPFSVFYVIDSILKWMWCWNNIEV